jgi:hypothetical protein
LPATVRVPDNIRKRVAFLACAKTDGTPVFCGSALFFSDDQDENKPAYLITARHVIDGIKGLLVSDVWVRINKSSGVAGWEAIALDRWILPDPHVDFQPNPSTGGDAVPDDYPEQPVAAD